MTERPSTKPHVISISLGPNNVTIETNPLTCGVLENTDDPNNTTNQCERIGEPPIREASG